MLAYSTSQLHSFVLHVCTLMICIIICVDLEVPGLRLLMSYMCVSTAESLCLEQGWGLSATLSEVTVVTRLWLGFLSSLAGIPGISGQVWSLRVLAIGH